VIVLGLAVVSIVEAVVRAQFGHESWELDALEPTVLGQLVRDEVDSLLDHDRWDTAVAREEAAAARLQAVSQRWAEVEALVG
jgi:hypothetical protein